MRLGLGLALSAALLTAACVVTPAPTTPGGVAGPSIPSTPLDLGGDWRGSAVGPTLQRFQREIADRYAQGLPLANIAVDLRRNDFECRAGRAGDAGTAPTQICRRTETVEDCTHTWQVHLFDANGDQSLARSRALYDRRCGGDGLLGGPD